MARRVIVSDPNAVRALIATTFLANENRVSRELGGVRLHPHQQDAAARILDALELHGGALLADSVGLGKTFTALAVASRFESVLVVAPAVLRHTWREAAARAGSSIEFASMESLARRGPRSGPAAYELVMVDEAHHFRSSRTRRYQTLAAITANARTLLLSATPLHNRSADLHALLALFLGRTAFTLNDRDLARFIIRREHSDLPGLRLPRLTRVRRIEIPGDEEVVLTTLALPPPVPPRDGGSAPNLVALGLAHAWSSSDAAFTASLRRRLAAGSAMRDALAHGRVPSRHELLSWSTADEVVQLAFPELVVADDLPSSKAMLRTLDDHLDAIRRLLRMSGQAGARDAHRVEQLRRIYARHANTQVLAFSCYADTIRGLYGMLAADSGIAAITASGGWIASGRASREDILRMFREPAHERERIRLLLATDLLSEGLNLPQAGVVVHIDLPWTAARLEQRTGRARRPDSNELAVRCYEFVQPRPVAGILRRELLVQRKARLAAASVGQLSLAERNRSGAPSPSRSLENLRSALLRWIPREGQVAGSRRADARRAHVAAVHASREGLMALLRADTGVLLIAGQPGGAECDLVSAGADPRAVGRWVALTGGGQRPVIVQEYRAARRAVERWLRERRALAVLQGSGETLQGIRGAILRRLDRAVSRAAPHERSDLAAAASRLRPLLLQSMPIGLENDLAELERRTSSDVFLVARLQRALATLPAPRRAGHEPTLIALLLLGRRRAPASRTPDN